MHLPVGLGLKGTEMSRPPGELPLLACHLDAPLIPTTKEGVGIARVPGCAGGVEGVGGWPMSPVGILADYAEEGVSGGFELRNPAGWPATGDVPLQPGGGGLPSGPGLQDHSPWSGWGWSAGRSGKAPPRRGGVNAAGGEKQGEYQGQHSILRSPGLSRPLREDRRWRTPHDVGLEFGSHHRGTGSLDVLSPRGGEGGRTPGISRIGIP